jgi:nicotinamidase-related amidase
MKLPANAVLLIIDVQKGFDNISHWGKRNNKNAEQVMSQLLSFWRENKRPVIHIKHNSTEINSPLRPELPGNAFKDEVKPQLNEKIFEKEVNSAFIGTELEKYLKDNSLNTLVIVGLTTDHCVSTTARMASNLGFKVYVVEDATATFERIGYDGSIYTAEQMHELALASLHNEFALVIKSTQMIDTLVFNDQIHEL